MSEGDPWADGHALVAQHLLELPDPEPPEEGLADWIELLGWLYGGESRLRATDTEVGRAVLASDLNRRREVACAATIQAHGAKRRGAHPLVEHILDRLAGHIRGTEGFSLGTADALITLRLAAESESYDAVIRVVNRIEKPRDPDLTPVFRDLLRHPTGTLRRYVWSLAERLWDFMDDPIRLVPVCSWTRRVVDEYDAADAEEKSWMRNFVAHMSVIGPSPTKRWTARTSSLLASSCEPYDLRFLRWFNEWVVPKNDETVWENERALRGFILATASADRLPVSTLESVAVTCHSCGSQKAGNDALRMLAGGKHGSSLKRVQMRVPNPQTWAFIDRLLSGTR